MARPRDALAGQSADRSIKALLFQVLAPGCSALFRLLRGLLVAQVPRLERALAEAAWSAPPTARCASWVLLNLGTPADVA